MKATIIMPLLDGGITSIDYETDSISGCPTCDYGSSYVDDFQIGLTKYTITVHINAMYDHLISENWLMRTLLGFDHDMAELAFCRMLKELISQHYMTKAPTRDTDTAPDYIRIVPVESGKVVEESILGKSIIGAGQSRK